jgi:citrate lyase subunit beta/citryl-CoA lyase
MERADDIAARAARWPRSYLFVPGDRPERFARAFTSGADAVVIDLEDAVASTQKAVAREHAARWLAAGAPTYVRINAADSIWFDDDLALCGASGLAGILLPKAERTTDLAIVAQACSSAARIVPIIESAQGFSRIDALAITDGVSRLAFGALDLGLDLDIEGEHEELAYFRSRLVLASRLARLPAPIDGVTVAVNDDAQLAQDTARARRFGFSARLCIHPRQIVGVHAGLAPTAAQLDWARRVVAAAEHADDATFALDGRMIDRPVILRAQALLARIDPDMP